MPKIKRSEKEKRMPDLVEVKLNTADWQSNDYWEYCDNCGHKMVTRKCEFVCPNCGFFRSCSEP